MLVSLRAVMSPPNLLCHEPIISLTEARLLRKVLLSYGYFATANTRALHSPYETPALNWDYGLL